MFKKEIRIIAWDDCAFSFSQEKVLLVGVIFRGGEFLDGMLSVVVKKDGQDSTDKVCAAILHSRHYDQLSVIMLDGITVAGFNVIDIKKLHAVTRLPVLVALRKRPDMKKFLLAMKRLKENKKRLAMAKSAGKIYKYNEIHYQKSGLTAKECEELLKLTCTRSKMPEPLRIAHLIASGLSRGTEDGFFESKGRS